MKFLQNLVAPIADVFKARIELKKTKIQAEASAYATAATTAADWEALAAQNAQGSWLDEYWTAVLTIPLVMAFLGAGETVDAGFKALENVPDWYRWAVLASVGWAFARKSLPGVGSWISRR